MNDYKITFARENGTQGTDTFTAANEKQARRDFNEVYRHGNGTITSVELVRADTPATKQQERDALERIRAILDTLGPNSYCRTAFDGCLQDAEDNIADDAAYSMKARLESVEQRLAKELHDHENTKEELRRTKLAQQSAEDNAAWLMERLDKQEANTISADDMTDIIMLVNCKRGELEIEVNNAALRIVESATEPGSAAFQNAVCDHRAAKADLDHYTAVFERLAALNNEQGKEGTNA